MIKSVKIALGVLALLVAMPLVNLGTSLALNRTLSSPMIQRLESLPPFIIRQDLTPKETETEFPVIRLEDPVTGFFCSGTIISDKYLLTASHCLMQQDMFGLRQMMRTKSLNVVSSTGLKVTGVAAAINQRADYALVIGSFESFRKLDVALTPKEVLEISPLIGTCGYPWGAGLFCSMAGPQIQLFYEFQITTGHLSPGSSGGACVDLMTNRVFAVNSAVTNGAIVIAPLIGLFETLGVEVIKE